MGHLNCPRCGTSVENHAQSCSDCGTQFSSNINPIAFFGVGMVSALLASIIFHWSTIPGLLAFGIVFYGLFSVTKRSAPVRHRRRY